jgi:hypothetical protein
LHLGPVLLMMHTSKNKLQGTHHIQLALGSACICLTGTSGRDIYWLAHPGGSVVLGVSVGVWWLGGRTLGIEVEGLARLAKGTGHGVLGAWFTTAQSTEVTK